MAVRTEEITRRLMDLAVDGVGIYIGDKVVEFVKPYTKKTLKKYNDGAVKIVASLLDLAIPKVRELPYVGDWLGLIGKVGVRDVLRTVVDKPADCWATDPNTIHCVNLDVLPDSIMLDGSKKAKDTDYTLSGTADEFDILLKTSLAGGPHDLVVAGSTKAFAGKIYV